LGVQWGLSQNLGMLLSSPIISMIFLEILKKRKAINVTFRNMGWPAFHLFFFLCHNLINKFFNGLLVDQRLWSKIGRNKGKMVCALVWWQFWNFIVRQVNFNSFLHPNKPHQRIFLYLVQQLEVEPSKVFSFQSRFFSQKINLILLKTILVLEY